MLLLLLSGCTLRVFFPPDMWDTGMRDSGWRFETPAEDTDEPDPSNPSEPVDTDVAPIEEVLTITTLTSKCTESPTTWDFSARADGWTGGGVLDVLAADGTREVHDLFLLDAALNGAWDELGTTLTDADLEPYTAGFTTAFACDEPLSFAVRIFDHFGATTDCVSWGDDPGSLSVRLYAEDLGVTALGGCRPAPESTTSAD